MGFGNTINAPPSEPIGVSLDTHYRKNTRGLRITAAAICRDHVSSELHNKSIVWFAQSSYLASSVQRAFVNLGQPVCAVLSETVVPLGGGAGTHRPGCAGNGPDLGLRSCFCPVRRASAARIEPWILTRRGQNKGSPDKTASTGGSVTVDQLGLMSVFRPCLTRPLSNHTKLEARARHI
jgi:hypothetical protein